MKATVIPIVISALGTIPKGLVKRLENLRIRGQGETIQNTALRSARIQRRVLETSGHLLSLRFYKKKQSANACVKTLKE